MRQTFMTVCLPCPQVFPVSEPNRKASEYAAVLLPRFHALRVSAADPKPRETLLLE